MAINLLPTPTGGAPTGLNDYNYQNAEQQGYHGLGSHNDILTEWETTDEPEIALGARMVHDGGLYECQVAIEAIAGAPSEGHVYVKLTHAAGVLTASFVNSDAGYTFNPIKGGWYHADGTQLLPFILLLYSGTLWKKTRAIISNLNETSTLSSCQIYPHAAMETIIQDDSVDSIPLPAGLTYFPFDNPNLVNSAGVGPTYRNNIEFKNYNDAKSLWDNRGCIYVNAGSLFYNFSWGNEGLICLRLTPNWTYHITLYPYIFDSYVYGGSTDDRISLYYDQATDKLFLYLYDSAGNYISVTTDAYANNAALQIRHDILIWWKKASNDADMWINNVRQGAGVAGTKTIVGTGISNLNMTSTQFTIGGFLGSSNMPGNLYYLQDMIIGATSGTTYLANYDNSANTKPYYLTTWYPGYKHSSLIDNNGNAGFNQASVEKLIAGSIDIGAGQSKMKKIPIGVWDMDLTALVNITHNLSLFKIQKISVMIIPDAGTMYFSLEIGANGGIEPAAAIITLTRQAAGRFDSVNYDDATMNRGYIYIWYAV